MAKELWCRRCESERDWSDIQQRGLDAEDQYCSCGAFAGPGSDEVLLIEDMTPEERADMDLNRAPEAAPIGTLEEIMAAIAAPPVGRVEATRNETGGVDITITIGDAIKQMSEVNGAIDKAIAKQFGALKPPSAESVREYNGPHGSAFDRAMDRYLGMNRIAKDEAPPDPKMRVPTFEEKEGERLIDALNIARNWEAMRPKG